jgi:uncharacterized protein (DUF2141 family)
MIRCAIFTLLLLFLACLQGQVTDSGNKPLAASGAVELIVKGLRNSEGRVLVRIFSGAKGFPKGKESLFRQVRLKINDRVATQKIEQVPFGHYAILVVHDENCNGKADYNWIGLPREGVGASGKGIGFRPPRFRETSILVKSDLVKSEIKLKYF